MGSSTRGTASGKNEGYQGTKSRGARRDASQSPGGGGLCEHGTGDAARVMRSESGVGRKERAGSAGKSNSDGGNLSASKPNFLHSQRKAERAKTKPPNVPVPV